MYEHERTGRSKERIIYILESDVTLYIKKGVGSLSIMLLNVTLVQNQISRSQSNTDSIPFPLSVKTIHPVKAIRSCNNKNKT